MNKALSCRPVLIAPLFCLVCPMPNRAAAVEALFLQDTYIDSNPTRAESPPAELSYESAGDLRVFKGNGPIGRKLDVSTLPASTSPRVPTPAGRAFLKFSLETVPPDTAPADVIQAQDHRGPG